MRILICGDVVGRSGRTVVLDNIKRLRATLKLDFIVVNGENAAGGFGITESICEEFLASGAECITLGNHAW
ncbi:MAG: YmdB family metallophosphoesterase, partial [Rhodospirillales bacterium]|nr:YmdB family metallophosphoesterase [Rhodospirillales bacterium]